MSDRPLLRWLPFVLLAGIYALELGIDVIDVDSAQYAHIAEEMWRTRSFLVVHNRGADYLDKPPLTFWLASASFALFGVSTWAYKLPSMLAALLAIFSTYRLTSLFYPRPVAWTSALMLGSTLAMFMWTNDVRTDTVLLGAVVFATWQLASSLVEQKRAAFWFGWIGIAAALMTKGPIGAVVPLVAVGAEGLRRRDRSWLLSPRWIGGVVLCLLLLSPMLWGLHKQFGGRGISFFFWTQSFGRITGESSWRDTTTPLFFTHTILWELLPWTLFFVIGFVRETVQLVRRTAEELVSWAGFTIPFVALSLSHYKLPHYVFVTVPFACMLAAKELERATTERFRLHFGVQLGVGLCLTALAAWFDFVAFPATSLGALLAGAALVSMVVFARPAGPPRDRLVLPAFAAMCCFGLMLATNFYPALLTYQAPSTAAHLIERNKLADIRSVYTYGPTSYALDFLLQRNLQQLPGPSALPPTGGLVITDEPGRTELAKSLRVREIAAFSDYPVSRWSVAFFNPTTRASRLQQRYLLEVSPR